MEMLKSEEVEKAMKRFIELSGGFDVTNQINPNTGDVYLVMSNQRSPFWQMILTFDPINKHIVIATREKIGDDKFKHDIRVVIPFDAITLLGEKPADVDGKNVTMDGTLTKDKEIDEIDKEFIDMSGGDNANKQS